MDVIIYVGDESILVDTDQPAPADILKQMRARQDADNERIAENMNDYWKHLGCED